MSRIFGIIVVLARLLASRPGGGAAPPPPVAGTWEITHVAVDGQDNPGRWELPPDDPQLVGRALVIGDGRVVFDAEKLACDQGVWTSVVVTWGRFFREGFTRPPTGGRPPHATPADFGFGSPPTARETAYELCPDAGRRGKGSFRSGAWVLVDRHADRLIYRHSDQVVFVLARRPADAKPTASFDCAAARKPTERAICADFNLASWDRSVALALAAAVRRAPDREAALRAEHKAWIAQRDTCGADAKCLGDRLWRRVETLVQE